MMNRRKKKQNVILSFKFVPTEIESSVILTGCEFPQFVYKKKTQKKHFNPAILCVCQCIERLMSIQAELQDSVKDLTKSRKKYQEAETMAQAVREKAELEAK